jgi:hypothetical protein
LSAIFL